MLLKSKRIGWLITGAVLVSSVRVSTTWSYLRTARAVVGQSIRDTVPIEFELKRLQQMTDDLIPEIRTNQKVAAQLEVEVEYLERELQTARQSQAEAKAQMAKLRKALDEPGNTFAFGGKRFTRPEVEQDLTRRLKHYDNAVAQLAAKERILTSRRQTLAAATEKIRQFQQQRDLLAQKAESLQAELKLVELGQAAGNFQFDHSKLGEAKELAQQVEKRIRTLQKLMDNDRHLAGEIPVEAENRPAQEQFDEYFKGK